MCFCVGDSKTVADIRNVLDNAKANGLKVIPWFNGSTTTMRNLVAGLKDRPAVIAWYVSDEPNTDAEKAVALERYNAVKQIDPSRPAYINYSVFPQDPMGDISCLDNYSISRRSPATPAETQAIWNALAPSEANLRGYGSNRMVMLFSILASPQVPKTNVWSTLR